MSRITVYVAFRGAKDIRTMLRLFEQCGCGHLKKIQCLGWLKPGMARMLLGYLMIKPAPAAVPAAPGSSAKTAVANPNGQVFGVEGLYISDASGFPTASGVNPMLSTMALAYHVAQHIKAGG